MNVKEFGLIMQTALREEGLKPLQLMPKAPKAWVLRANDVIRFFQPHPQRRPWGFIYSGTIGIEIPALREWLRTNKAGEEGAFHTCFVGYYVVNEDVFRSLMVTHGDPVPADLWSGLIKYRLDRIPPTLEQLIASYRRNKEELGWLAHPHERHAWEFLLRWFDDPSASLPVPRREPDGRIIDPTDGDNDQAGA